MNVFDKPFETTFIWWRNNEVAPICSINKDFELDESTGYKMIVYAFCDYIYRDELLAFNRGTGRKCFYPLLGGSNTWVLIEPDIEDDNFGRFVN